MSKQCSEEKTWFPPMEPTWCAPSFRAMHICCNPVGVSTALHNAMPGHKAIDPAGSLSASELEWISKPGCQAPVQAVNCRTALKKVRGNRMMRKKKGNSSSLQNLLKRDTRPLHTQGASKATAAFRRSSLTRNPLSFLWDRGGSDALPRNLSQSSHFTRGCENHRTVTAWLT